MADITQGKEGEIYIEAIGQWVRIMDWREDDYYDTAATTSGLQTAGTQLDFFKSQVGASGVSKNLQATNLTQPSKIDPNHEFILARIGVLINQCFANTITSTKDVLRIAYNGVLTVRLNQRLVTQGPVVKYQSGYGVVGSTTENSVGLATTGVASAAAAPNLLVSQLLTEKTVIEANVMFRDNLWVAAAPLPTFDAAGAISVFMHGFLKRPANM